MRSSKKRLSKKLLNKIKRSKSKSPKRISKQKHDIKKKQKVSLTILLDGNCGKIWINNQPLINKNDGSCDLTKDKSVIVSIVNKIKELPLYKEAPKNWDKLKTTFKSNKEKYINDMKNIITYRQQLVDELQKQYCKECNFTTSGSGSLTSDIDVTVSKTTPDFFGVKEIKEMNDVMKCLFDSVESLISLDVNFYGHSFVFPINVANFCIQVTPKEFYPVFDDVLEAENKFQEALAILKIKKYDNDIFKFNFNYNECKKIIDTFNKQSLSNYDLFNYVINNLDLTEQNKLYFEQLEMIEKFSDKIKTEPNPKLIEANRYKLICEISKASMFADETYYTYGAFMHIVYFTQMKRNITLHPVTFLHSMLENFGDTLKVYLHTIPFDETNFIKSGCKYMMRIYDAILKTAKLIDSENTHICKLFISFFNIREQVKKELPNDKLIDEEIAKIKDFCKDKSLINTIKNDVMFVYKTKFDGKLIV